MFLTIPYFSTHCISDHCISNPNLNPYPDLALTMTVLTFWSEMWWSEMQWAEKGITVFDLLVDIWVVRNEEFSAVLVMLLGLRGCAIHGLLCSMHDKLYVMAWITIVEKNLADVLKFILLWRTNVVTAS